MTDSRFISSCLVCALFVGLSSCGDNDDAGGAHGGSSGSGSSSSGGAPTGGTTSGGAANHGGSDVGGAGGTGAELTLEEACDKTCADQSVLDCAFDLDDCVSSCEGFAVDPDLQAPDKYLSMLRCQAERLGPSDYACLPMDPDPVIWPGPVSKTSCEPAICAWYCAEETVWGNSAVYYRCNCE